MASSSLVVHRITGLAGIRAAGPEWADLHDSSGSTNPFAGPEWPTLWFERFLGEDESWLLQVRDGDRLVGVVPLYRHASRVGPAVLHAPGTIAPWIGPFELPRPLVAAGEGRAVMRAVVEYLVRYSDRWDWVDVALSTDPIWFEQEWIPDGGANVLPRGTLATPFVPLGPDADTGAGSRRNLKESVRRARNRLTRAYGEDGWCVRRVQDAAEIGPAFDRLAVMHASRANRQDKRAHADVFEDPEIKRYVRDVVVAMAGRDRASIYELVVGDTVITSQLVLATATSSYFSVSGMAPEAWEFSPVTYLQKLAVDDAEAAGHVEMNLSAGPNQTKLRWTRHIRTHAEFSLVGTRPRSRAMFRAWSAVSANRRLDEATRAQRGAPDAQ